MSYTAEQLLELATQFDAASSNSLNKIAQKFRSKDTAADKRFNRLNPPPQGAATPAVGAAGEAAGKPKTDLHNAKDPKAKVRNRGTVCVPAESAKDKKDHFPINDEGQARSALSRVEGLTSAPWYNGSLEGLRALVKRKVRAKYPKIDVGGKKKDKKSSLEHIEEMLVKYV
jgi:hypothetical protein